MTPLQLEAAAGARGKSFLPEWARRLGVDEEYGPGWVDSVGQLFLSKHAVEALIIAGAAKDLNKQGVAVYVSLLPGKKEPCWVEREAGGSPRELDAASYEQAVTLAAGRRLDAEKERSGG